MRIAFTLLLLASVALAQRPPRDEVDEAIDRSLAFLERMQEKDGSWQIRGASNVAVSSLAMLAFLSSGHVPGEGPYADVTERGIRWILTQQHPSGVLSNEPGIEMYHHGIATLLLSQNIGMTKGDEARTIKSKLEKAVQAIVSSQVKTPGPNAGGWRYRVDSSDADLSITGWQIMALRGARNVGCDVPAETVEAALGYVDRLRDPTSGGYAYMSGWAPSASCTGTALMVLELSGKKQSRSRESLLAGSFVLKTPLEPGHQHYYYAVYNTSQGMFQLGRNYWNSFRPVLHKQLLGLQERGGAWQDPNGNGPVYATAMGTLALTVEYRYLPIYQKDEGR